MSDLDLTNYLIQSHSNLEPLDLTDVVVNKGCRLSKLIKIGLSGGSALLDFYFDQPDIYYFRLFFSSMLLHSVIKVPNLVKIWQDSNQI